MKKVIILCCSLYFFMRAPAQQVLAPDQIYGQLFTDVQTAKIFPDGKTFVDCIPKREPKSIMADYGRLKNNPNVRYSLKLFVEANFNLPVNPATTYQSNNTEDAATHIRNLWKVLRRNADTNIKGSSLLPLPLPYIVPGGRFREIYYWDSYFTMLGLQESGESGMMQNMINNFAYLIETYGHIPNGNRTYYLGRSQPPFFSLMVSLLAEVKGDSIYKTYLPAMKKEYSYWMEGAATLQRGQAYKRVVKLPDGAILNRYWDEVDAPRQESYLQDVETTEKSHRSKSDMYHHLRAGAASGWDFSSRWFKDAKNITTIQTTDIVPVDLNCLLYGLEMNIAKAALITQDKALADTFTKKAAARKAAVLQYTWNSRVNFFTDYNFSTRSADTMITAAGSFPLFMQVATPVQAGKVAAIISSKLLKEGGVVTTNNNTGQQWDAPNGWAPLQWVAIKGLENYHLTTLAANIAQRWLALNDKVFKATGKMMEKYNVLNTHLDAGGGEYPGQDGFGWTNGVYLKLTALYRKNAADKIK